MQSDQNVSGGVRYLAWLIQRFHNDLRLAVAAYYVGDNRIESGGLATEILTSSHMSQELEQLIFANQE
jgi:soluble lytic murein transglycosylase-like protein